MKIRADLGMEKYIVGCYADMFSIDTRRRLNHVSFGQSIRNQVYFVNYVKDRRSSGILCFRAMDLCNVTKTFNKFNYSLSENRTILVNST